MAARHAAPTCSIIHKLPHALSWMWTDAVCQPHAQSLLGLCTRGLYSARFLQHSGIRFPQNGCFSCPWGAKPVTLEVQDRSSDWGAGRVLRTTYDRRAISLFRCRRWAWLATHGAPGHHWYGGVLRIEVFLSSNRPLIDRKSV